LGIRFIRAIRDGFAKITGDWYEARASCLPCGQ